MIRRRLPGIRGLRWYFDHNDGRMIHKWDHYFDIYERHFARFRGRAPRVLEIGVSHGGSLQMWRWYFGRSAKIVGVDIAERVRTLAEPGIAIEVGDQSDPEFLRSLAAAYGPFDIIIDDGSHRPAHQVVTFETLWEHLADGGVFLVEDLHSNYWSHLDGGRGVPTTFIELTKRRIDDLHAHHSRDADFAVTDWTRSIGGIHCYDSIVVFDKEHRAAPVDRRSGRPQFDTEAATPIEDLIDDDHRRQLASLSSPTARLRRLVRDPRGTLRRALARVRR